MPHYHVNVRRTEDITFAVEADSPEDAEARYLRDGDEIASSTDAFVIIDIQEAP
jgi:hypothetical protein